MKTLIRGENNTLSRVLTMREALNLFHGQRDIVGISDNSLKERIRKSRK
jgi:hypothetical protein